MWLLMKAGPCLDVPQPLTFWAGACSQRLGGGANALTEVAYAYRAQIRAM